MLKINALLTSEEAEQLIDNQAERKESAKTFLGFCLTYFPHYFTLPAADIHPEMISDLGNWELEFLSQTGFRGCAKSTLASMALPIYAGLEGKSKFIIPINETAEVAKLTIANIREELLTNELLRADYGITKISGGANVKFTETNIMLPNYEFRIMGLSRGQKIRGLRHRQYRPDLFILDDVEERKKVKNKSYREETEAWLNGDVIPSCEETKARLVVIGNELHADALMARLRKNPLFLHRDYPLIIGAEIWANCVWKGKYPNQGALNRQKAKVGTIAWKREYLLKVIPPDEQIVKEEWIKYYKKIPTEIITNAEGEPEEVKKIIKTGVGVDPAIGKKATNDFTAMVGGFTGYVDGNSKIHIIPKPVNERLSFNETLNRMKTLNTAFSLQYSSPMFYFEQVAYQQAGIEEAQRRGLPVQGIRPGDDKKARLSVAAVFIENGTVLFPEHGCEDLIEALLTFGVSEHDDLVDAFVYLVLALVGEGLDNLDVISLD